MSAAIPWFVHVWTGALSSPVEGGLRSLSLLDMKLFMDLLADRENLRLIGVCQLQRVLHFTCNK